MEDDCLRDSLVVPGKQKFIQMKVVRVKPHQVITPGICGGGPKKGRTQTKRIISGKNIRTPIVRIESQARGDFFYVLGWVQRDETNLLYSSGGKKSSSPGVKCF